MLKRSIVMRSWMGDSMKIPWAMTPASMSVVLTQVDQLNDEINEWLLAHPEVELPRELEDKLLLLDFILNGK